MNTFISVSKQLGAELDVEILHKILWERKIGQSGAGGVWFIPVDFCLHDRKAAPWSVSLVPEQWLIQSRNETEVRWVENVYLWGTGEGVLQEKRVNLKNCKVSGGSSQVKVTENDRCGHSCRCNKW